MMGSGKSTTGRMLSNVLRYCFFDCDSVIEQAVGGATVSQIFEENGEDGFRDLEQTVLQELSAYKNCVIATGGGVVARCAPGLHIVRVHPNSPLVCQICLLGTSSDQ
jgi:shikimate kinase